MHLYESATRLYPKNYVRYFKQELIYSGDKRSVHIWLGKTLYYSFIVSVIAFILSLIFGLNIWGSIGLFLFIILAAQFGIYILLYFKVDSRKTKVEKALPDILQLIASNLQAGMTPFNAIKATGRKEFEPLSSEFKRATDKGLGTGNFAKELLKIGERINSQTLKRALKLITSALSSGGHLAKLLEELSEDIAETQSLKNEMVTNTKTYTMFIMFTIIVGAPLLFAISIHFVGMVQDMQNSVTLSTDEFGLGFMTGEMEITPGFLTYVSFAILFITSLLSTMLSGTIAKGEATAGLKNAPWVIAASILIFILAKILNANFFAGL